jgi:hypothetical protein
MQGLVCQLEPCDIASFVCQVGPWTNARSVLSGWALGRPGAGEAPGREFAWYPTHRLALLAATTLQHTPCQAHREVSSLLIYCLCLIFFLDFHLKIILFE